MERAAITRKIHQAEKPPGDLPTRSPVAARPENGAASCTQLAVLVALTRAEEQRPGADLRCGAVKPRLHFGRSARGPVMREESK